MPKPDENKLLNVFHQASIPFAIAVLESPQHRFTMANEKFLKIFGRTWEQVCGKPIGEVFPRFKTQGIYELFEKVYLSGKSFIAEGLPVEWDKDLNGEIIKGFFNLTFDPIKNAEGTFSSIMLHCQEVTRKVETNESRYGDMLLQLPLAFAVLKGKDMVVDFANAAIEEMWGRRNINGLELLEILPELRTQDFPRLLDECYSTGITYKGYEMPAKLVRNGKLEINYYNFEYHAHRGADDQIIGVTITAVDVTKEVFSKKNLEESEKRFRTIVQQAPVAIMSVRGENFIIEIANEKMLHFCGQTAEQLIGKPVFECMPDTAGQGFEALLTSVITTGKTFTANELPLKILRNGKVENSFVNLVYEPIYDEERNVTGIIGVHTDITEQVNARMKIQESENRYASMIHSSPLIICILEGQDFIIKIANDSLIAYLGKGKNIIGQPFLITNPELEAQGIGDILREVFRSGIAYQIFETPIYLMVNGQKSERYYNYLAQPQRKVNGEIEGIAITATEVTEQVKQNLTIKENESRYRELSISLEEKVKKRTEELEKMNEELTSFAYIGSHDLQEPLRKIQMFCGRIKEQEIHLLSNEGKVLFNKMEHAAERMQKLINDLLAYSQTISTPEDFVKTDLNEIIDDVKNELKEFIEEKNAVIVIDALCHINVIPFQFNQLIHNLISNALKYSKPGIFPYISIKSNNIKYSELNIVDVHPTNEYCHISVSDNGIGFDPQYNKQVFSLFTRLHGRTEYKGTGIGLAIVKRIVENHHGFITASGNPNSGATFDIFLPIE